MLDVKVGKDDILNAYMRWYDYWGHGGVRWRPFWAWVEVNTNTGPNYGHFYMSPQSARKIRLLNSEHYLTILKMIEAS